MSAQLLPPGASRTTSPAVEPRVEPRSRSIAVSALIAGVVFGIGLGISGMTQPRKVIGFLDIAGDWDPSLAFVMLGAIGVHFVVVRRVLRKDAPRFATRFFLPTRTEIDGWLIGGSALFGIGWGLGGYCPGPAVVHMVSLAPSTIVFVAGMIVGTFATRWWMRPRPEPPTQTNVVESARRQASSGAEVFQPRR